MPASTTDQPKYLVQHLVELRQRLIRCLVIVVIGMVAAFWKSVWLFELLLRPFHKIQDQFPDFAAQVHSLQTLTPIEAFMINMKLATFAGLILASPFILREIWAFSVPALKTNERGAILMVFCLGLFFLQGDWLLAIL